jgi:hypothetical protein
MFFRSPLGRLISAIASIGLVIALYFAFTGSDKDDSGGVTSEDPTAVSEEQSLYSSGNFEKALDKLRSEESANAEMLKVVVRPADAEFQVRKGERADGYRYNAKSEDLESVEVELVGSGTLEGSQFSLARVRPGITTKLVAALREENPELKATNMALERGVGSGRLAWTVNAEGGGRTGLVFMARPDGSGLADPVEFARQGGGGDSGSGGTTKAPSVDEAQRQAQCIRKAGSDVAKVQACLK